MKKTDDFRKESEDLVLYPIDDRSIVDRLAIHKQDYYTSTGVAAIFQTVAIIGGVNMFHYSSFTERVVANGLAASYLLGRAYSRRAQNARLSELELSMQHFQKKMGRSERRSNQDSSQ